ncbi:Uncharacterised protein [Vibrio cholerae]|nr:Uncharacterised protein [Vibrio cholerae]
MQISGNLTIGQKIDLFFWEINCGFNIDAQVNQRFHQGMDAFRKLALQ